MTDEQTTNEAPDLHEQEVSRRANREAIAALGLDPYGGRTDKLISLADAHAAYDEAADAAHQGKSKEESADPGYEDPRPVVAIAGRVVLKRDTGKLVWLNLRDDTETLQVAVSKRDAAEPGFEVAKHTDLGDLVVARGPVMKTRTGETTIWASSFAPAGKSLTPPPSKHAGLTDPELRYRQRYVDLWSNPETMRVFQLRARIVSCMRDFLRARGYVEVETPMLQAQAGGAAATPFRTHLNALGIDLFLRIAPELYLKRLLVAGMPRVFEINRNFRNEGVDRSHNPEFTMLELYHAHGNYETVMALTEDVVREAARVAVGARAHEDRVDGESTTLPFGELDVCYEDAFDRVTYAALFERALGFGIDDHDRAIAEAANRGMRVTTPTGSPLDPIFIVNELFEHVAEPTLDPSRPTWIMDYPAALSPLTKAKRDDPSIAERADLFIGGMEIGPHYTELNDPDVQEERFRAQLAGLDSEEQTFRTLDTDFLRALKVGMPPAGGLGLGIDRLAMLLTDQRSIRDVVLFPFMRPEESGGPGH